MSFLFPTTFMLHAAAALLARFSTPGRGRAVMAAAVAVQCAWFGLHVRRHGVLPVFTPVEALQCAGMVLGLLTLLAGPRTTAPTTVLRWAAIATTLMAGGAIILPAPHPCFDYNHVYLPAVAFHVFRRLALAAALFSSALFIAALRRNGAEDGEIGTGAILRHQGRNALLAALVLYLLSEDTGILWCLYGWADVWQWSPGFIISSAVLIYLMLALHLPGGSRRNGSSWYAVLGLLGGPLMLAAQLLKP
ncbi:MAG: hypothetical protein JW781_08530 [Deltaproteobacteria bacterium]|nr:hypothetical protein [Candidatus Anaeroferrophillacea bacterium]